MFRSFTKLEDRINAKLKYINLRQLLGIIVFVLGLFLSLCALYGYNQIAQAKSEFGSASRFFGQTSNPAIKMFGGAVHDKITSYYLPVTIALIVGVLLIFGGVYMVKHFRKRRNK